MVKCEKCGVETYMPFRCNYCGGYFCEQHRLPEFHDCKGKYQEAGPSSVRIGDYSASGSFGSYSTSRVIRPYWFSQTELRDLAIGLLVITLIPLFRVWWAGLFSDPIVVVGYVGVLVLAFMLHELAHKFMAQRLGMWAEFRLNMTGLILTIFSFLLVQGAGFPLMIIAPGAVMIAGMMNWKEYGRIAIAGPATNIAEALVFAVIFLASPEGGLVWLMGYLGMTINSGLALFNLIPFGVFDGLKIFKWSWRVWLVAVALSGGIFLYTIL
jgi:Zn-dependent protease